MVWSKKDVIAQCLTQKSKCVIYLTVGDRCRVFPLHKMYERVDTAVVIILVLDIRLYRLCLIMHECSY